MFSGSYWMSSVSTCSSSSSYDWLSWASTSWSCWITDWYDCLVRILAASPSRIDRNPCARLSRVAAFVCCQKGLTSLSFQTMESLAVGTRCGGKIRRLGIVTNK